MHRFFLTLSNVMAWLGGAVLCVLIAMTCVSVLGRGLGFGPVPGDFELVEAGIAFAIFAFLPLCQITGAHATVDIFTARWSDRANRWRQMITDVVFATVLVLIAVQLASGMFSKLGTGQTTFLIQFPLWWAYAFSLVGAAVAAVVSLYLALIRVFEAVQGSAILPEGAS